MTAVCETLGVARSNIARRIAQGPAKPRGRPPLPEEPLRSEIMTVIADMPSYGYPRVWAVLRRRSEARGDPPANRKRVYRLMKMHGLLLQKHAGGQAERTHDGRIAVAQSNLRWCSDGFEIACDNAERVRVAFALDCCDREAMSHIATTTGIKGEDIRDLMVTAVEHRFGRLNRLPETIEWLSDNGACYTAADTRRFARDIAISASSPYARPLKVRNPTAWRKPSCEPSNVITWPSTPSRMPRPLSDRCPVGSSITTRCIRIVR
jgi:putative transposase